MIEKEQEQINQEREHRRRGSAFDTLANVFRNVKELVFQNEVTIRNRPGEDQPNNVENVLEILANKKPKPGKLNYFYYGRRGIADKQGDEKTNVNYHEMTANYDSNGPKGPESGNGNIFFLVREDGVLLPVAQISLVHANAYDKDLTGIRAAMSGEGDGGSSDNGGSQMVYFNNSNGSITGIDVSKRGIQMYGLPTSSSGLEPNTIWNDGGTLKITS